MVRQLTRRQILERIDDLLHWKYCEEDLGNKKRPLDELIFILLSAQTKHDAYSDCYSKLITKYSSWSSVQEASVKDLEYLLQPYGLSMQKARRLKALLGALKLLRRDHNSRSKYSIRENTLSLDFLRHYNTEEAEELLISLPGIGVKTARCVLLFSLGRDVFPVDVNIHRVVSRIGFLGTVPYRAAHNHFQNAVPPELRYRLHVNLIHHGRDVCTPRSPRCSRCILTSFCKHFLARTNNGQEGGYTAIDLFSGAGSLSAGFIKAGWNVVCAVERDQHAAQTYRYNNPGVIVVEQDVLQLKGEELLQIAGLEIGDVDAVIGGPPCQGYSQAGKRDPDSPQNYYYRTIGTVARNIGAKSLVMENVPGILNVNGKKFARRIRAHFRRMGFNTEYFLLSSTEFGVPQKRNRIFYFGIKKSFSMMPYKPKNLDIPQLISLGIRPVLSVKDAFRRLPKAYHPDNLNAGNVTKGSIINHVQIKHSTAVVSKIRKIPRGDGPISYRRLELTTARTIIAGHRALPVHPVENRTITVREAARLQTLPDDYIFLGPRHSQPLQVANVVPFNAAVVLGVFWLNTIQGVQKKRTKG